MAAWLCRTLTHRSRGWLARRLLFLFLLFLGPATQRHLPVLSLRGPGSRAWGAAGVRADPAWGPGPQDPHGCPISGDSPTGDGAQHVSPVPQDPRCSAHLQLQREAWVPQWPPTRSGVQGPAAAAAAGGAGRVGEVVRAPHHGKLPPPGAAGRGAPSAGHPPLPPKEWQKGGHGLGDAGHSASPLTPGLAAAMGSPAKTRAGGGGVTQQSRERRGQPSTGLGTGDWGQGTGDQCQGQARPVAGGGLETRAEHPDGRSWARPGTLVPGVPRAGELGDAPRAGRWRGGSSRPRPPRRAAPSGSSCAAATHSGAGCGQSW